MAKVCVCCGATFEPKRKEREATQVFCSRPCARSKNGGHNRKDETWWVDAKGYIQGRIWVDGKQRRVKQHRLFMERHIGRPLRDDEHVHHLDGNKQNNDLSNLELLTSTEHARISNAERTYTRGKKIKLSDAERKRRSDWMKSVHAKRAASTTVSPQAQGQQNEGAES